jgi:soluble lytic murein transglycosylase
MRTVEFFLDTCLNSVRETPPKSNISGLKIAINSVMGKRGTTKGTSLIQRGAVAALSMVFVAAAPIHKHFKQIKPTRKDIRVHQAKELLGHLYKRSIVKTGEDVADVPQFVYSEVDGSLKVTSKKEAKLVARTILLSSHKYQFDPIFVMSIIDHESMFDPTTRGKFGEIGLMQIKPSTAEWISKKYGIKYDGEKSLLDPCTNVMIGTAYVDYLRDRFREHGRLYLAAYNMGVTNVNRALAKTVWPKDYPSKVMQHYIKYYSELRTRLDKQQPHNPMVVAEEDRLSPRGEFLLFPTRESSTLESMSD